jgi:hypothetical protein
VRMYQERIRDVGESKLTARRAVEAMVDINRRRCPTGSSARRPTPGTGPASAETSLAS